MVDNIQSDIIPLFISQIHDTTLFQVETMFSTMVSAITPVW